MSYDPAKFDPAKFDKARADMVAQQLARRGIHDQRVLDAMRRVPREAFLPAESAGDAYADAALPIDCEQTISQPLIVALMSQALQLTGRERVLEVGTGSGYQTAILAELAAAVFSVERHADLSRQAEQRLRRLGYHNVLLKIGDGALGWQDEALPPGGMTAPWDRIVVTAAAESCPPALWQQLAEGGILVGPFGPPTEQSLVEVHKIAGQPQSKLLTGCRFVPLVPGVAKGRSP